MDDVEIDMFRLPLNRGIHELVNKPIAKAFAVSIVELFARTQLEDNSPDTQSAEKRT
jgi:hypothetical protein